MPQRAILDGDTDVLAFDAEDGVWAGLAAAYSGERLALPCCGSPAIPKENAKGTRWFAHGPYRRVSCDWKATDARHESVLSAVCKVAVERGWLVATEIRGDGWKADVVCRRAKAEVRVVFQVELRKRPDGEIAAEDAAFARSGIMAVWLFPERRRHSRPEVRKSDTVPTGEGANVVGEAAARAARVLARVETAFRNANAAIRALREAGWNAEPVFESGVPLHVKASKDGEEATLRTDRRVELMALTGHGVRRHDEAALQREVAQALKGRLEKGIELWWPGYPELEADTFDRLKAEAARPRHVAERTIPLSPPVRTTPPREPPPPDPELMDAARRGETAPCPPMDMWAEARSRHIRRAAATVLPPDEVDLWMDTRNVSFGGLTPNELAARTSNAIEDCEIDLGLRDPATRNRIYP